MYSIVYLTKITFLRHAISLLLAIYFNKFFKEISKKIKLDMMQIHHYEKFK